MHRHVKFVIVIRVIVFPDVQKEPLVVRVNVIRKHVVPANTGVKVLAVVFQTVRPVKNVVVEHA